MRKLLNTLYVTSENSYLGLDGENVVVWISWNKSGTYGSLCRQKYFPLLFDTSGKVSGKDYRKNKRKCHIKGTTVFKL